MTDVLFVYGTLRTAELPDDVRNLGLARARGRLYEHAPASYPVFVPDVEGDLVVGELLEYDPDGTWFQTVARVEQRAGYVLGEVKLEAAADMSALPVRELAASDAIAVVKTWVWTGPVDEDLRIGGGDWLDARVGFGDEVTS